MSADSRSIGEPGSLTSSCPAHLNLYRHWPTGPSINMSDSCSSPSSCRSMAWIFSPQTDIMTSDGEVVNILLSEINTHTHTAKRVGGDQSVCLLSYRCRRSITLWMEDERRREDWLFLKRAHRDSLYLNEAVTRRTLYFYYIKSHICNITSDQQPSCQPSFVIRRLNKLSVCH